MATLVFSWRVLCALIEHKPLHGHGHGHGGKVEGKYFVARTKTQGRLLLFWVGCVPGLPHGCVICYMLYEHMGTLQPQTTKMRAYLPG